jgi:anti-anti-sigma factor
MADGVSVTVEHLDGVMLVRVAGDVDAATVATLAHSLQLAPANATVQVHCGEVTFMDSTGLREILRHSMRLTDGGGSLRVIEPSKPVRLLFSVSGLDSILE